MRVRAAHPLYNENEVMLAFRARKFSEEQKFQWQKRPNAIWP